MALDTEKSPFDAQLSSKAKGYGRWNYRENERDHPDVARKVRHFSDAADEKPGPQGAEEKERIAIQGICAVPDLSLRNPNHHKVPSNRFCKRKTNYVERKPLVSQTACVNDVCPRFSGLDLSPTDQQIKTAECSNSAQRLRGTSESPVVLPSSTMDSKYRSTSVESLQSFEADFKSRLAFTYSSTPKPLPGKSVSRLDVSTPLFPPTSLFPKPSEDADFEQRERTRSKSFSVSGALPSFDAFTSRHLHRLSDPKEASMTGTRKQIPAGGCLAAGQIRKMSPFQVDYWACAIPDSLPPSPDRQSPHWNPNKEYEDLLDYTYPLRPKYKLAKSLKYGIRDSSIHDSGIDLDRLSISPESTLKSTSVPGQELQTMGVPTAQRFRAPLSKKPECSVPMSHYGISPFGKVSFAVGGPIDEAIFSRELAPALPLRCVGPASSDSTNVEKQQWNVRKHYGITRDTSKHDCLLRRVATGGFIRSTRMLPLQNEYFSDEYLPLPPRLKELERLAQQLTDLSLTIRKPGHGLLEDGFPSKGLSTEHLSPEIHGGDRSHWEMDCDSCCVSSCQECSEEDLLSNQGCEDCVNPHKDAANADAKGFVETECFKAGSEHQEKAEVHHDSLAWRIKVFCCRLEELIRWLHKIAEMTDNWIPPKPDVESVKASLQSYLAFKKDLASHQALTEDVLQDGERLLKNMASSSPVLQRALVLIVKQSFELESNSDRLYQSILEALDTLDSSLKKSGDIRQPDSPTEASKWLTSATL